MISLGVIFAILAMLFWGFGDFFIQRATRKTGAIGSLFYICLASTIVLPIFIPDILSVITHGNFLLLALTGFVAFFAGLFYFEALEKGKISIVEPILGLELPVTIILSITIFNEILSLTQALLVLSIFIGIILTITKHHTHLHYHKRLFEKGVLLAGLGAVTMGLMNFLVGISANNAPPLFVIWFIHLLILILCISYFSIKGGFSNLYYDFRKYTPIILAEATLDNAAWISFAYAVTLIPISIATSISESYIALAVTLGLVINKEKIAYHQKIGIAMAIVGVILLSYITG